MSILGFAGGLTKVWSIRRVLLDVAFAHGKWAAEQFIDFDDDGLSSKPASQGSLLPIEGGGADAVSGLDFEALGAHKIDVKFSSSL